MSSAGLTNTSYCETELKATSSPKVETVLPAVLVTFTSACSLMFAPSFLANPVTAVFVVPALMPSNATPAVYLPKFQGF